MLSDRWLGHNHKKASDAGKLGNGLKATALHPMTRKSRQTTKSNAPRSRVNRKRVLLVGLVVVLMAASIYPLELRQDAILRRSALAQARQLADSDQLNRAIISVDHYLQDWPDDIPGLELMGELLTKGAASPHEVYRGTQVIDQLLRLDPEPAARQEDRKRLIILSIRLSDIIRASSDKLMLGVDKYESRYRFANKVAEQRIKLGAEDGESYRLLGTTLERLFTSGDEASGPLAIKAYQKALRKDPGDFTAAERLATLRLEFRKGDQAGADQILDDLVRARPRAVEARLVRARHFIATGREERAKTDADAASKLAPTDPSVRVMAASLALRRGDTAAAKAHLAAVPAEHRDNSRVAILLCQVELAEHRPEEAVKKLRQGLARSLGTDSDLTWRLALTLIQLGRPTEARPVIAQYGRLCGRDDHPMLRFLEGTIRERAGRQSSAIAWLEPARDGMPEEWRTELEMTLGRCYQAVGDPVLAQAAFTNARNKSPNAPAPRAALARILRPTNDDKATAELEEGIRRSRSPSLHADLIVALVGKQLTQPAEKRNWSAAEAAIDRAVRSKISDPAITRARVEMLAASGRVDEAGSLLEEATKGPARLQEDGWLARAQYLKNQGRIDDALKVLEEASSTNAAGPRVSLRVARADLLARSGHGRAALEILAHGVQNLPVADLATLARAKGELLIKLGDRQGARAAFVEWAELCPEDLEPGLKMLEMARKGGTGEDLDLGIEMLRKVGGDDKVSGGDEPIALIAQAFGILLPAGGDDAVDASRLELAEQITQRLQDVAPKLPITALIRGMMLERSSAFEEAVTDYKLAMNGDTTGLALPRLIALLTRLKRTDDIAALKAEGTPVATVNRISIDQTLDSGDKQGAEVLLAQLVEADPDIVDYRAEQARLLRSMGKLDLAEAKILEIVKLHPELAQPWLALMAIQLERGDRPAAQATVERLKLAYKGDRPDLLIVRGLAALGDREGAIKVCTQELARRPGDLASLRVGSELEEAAGRLDRAESLLAQALKVNPDLGWARRRMALILSMRPGHARWAEARAMVSRLGSVSTDSPEDRMVRATVLLRGPDESHKAEAIAAFKSMADDLPASNSIGRSARLELTRLLMSSGESAEAARAIVPAATESASPIPSTLALAIEATVAGERLDEARRLLERLIKVEPDSPMTTVCRALVLKAEGESESASSLLVEAAAAAEKSSDGERLNRYYFEQLWKLGSDSAAESMGRNLVARWPSQGAAMVKFLTSKGRYDEAIETASATVDAGFPREPIRLLLTMVNQGKIDGPAAERAITLAQSASARFPKDFDLMSMGAAILRNRHRFEDEASLYRKVLETDPDNVAVRNNLAWVFSHDLARPADGLVEIDRVIRQTGQMPQVIDTRCMILIQLDRVDEAIADLERIARLDPSALRHIHLARAYAKAGRADDRRRSREAAKLVAVNLKALDPEDRAELEATNP